METLDLSDPRNRAAINEERMLLTTKSTSGVDLSRYWSDPVAFVNDFLPALSLHPYQADILHAIGITDKVAARSARGGGKSTTASAAILWFACTREAAGVDWKVITTASAWRQLTKFLWPEVRKWAPKLRFVDLGMQPWQRQKELLDLGIKLEHGEASAVASNEPDSVEGGHADELLAVFDESKAIADEIWDASDGWFSSGNTKMLAVSTPGTRSGRFYEIFAGSPGMEGWSKHHVTIDQVLEADQVRAEWVDGMRDKWGETHPFYRQQVLAEFADITENGVIPLEWVEAAQHRWLERDGQGDPVPLHVGCDFARHGTDENVMAMRRGNVVTELQTWQEPDLMQTVGRITQELRRSGGSGCGDADGLGAGAVDRIREQGFRFTPFHGAPKIDQTDRTGELTFFNTRTAAWWQLRERLDPANASAICLPPDEQLTADLTAPKWDLTSSGQVRVEAKKDTKKRLQRSPDRGDAVVLAFWDPPAAPAPPAEQFGFGGDDGWRRKR